MNPISGLMYRGPYKAQKDTPALTAATLLAGGDRNATALLTSTSCYARYKGKLCCIQCVPGYAV